MEELGFPASDDVFPAVSRYKLWCHLQHRRRCAVGSPSTIRLRLGLRGVERSGKNAERQRFTYQFELRFFVGKTLAVFGTEIMKKDGVEDRRNLSSANAIVGRKLQPGLGKFIERAIIRDMSMHA